MLSKKEQDKPGILLPPNWCKKVEEVLTSTYKAQCDATAKEFQVHGITYPDELFLAVGLFDPQNLLLAPVTYVISLDLESNKNEPETYLDTLIDSMGIFFDSFFADANWNDYQAVWTEAEYKSLKFHYKVSRENLSLSIQAESLLNQ
jgi:hypothetical protein